MKKHFLNLLLLGIIIAAGSVFFWIKSSPSIIITPEKALIDEPVEISIANLKPHTQITVEATCKNKDNDAWKSYAIFQADDKGVVDIAKQAPIDGSYQGIDPMGLFWSMVPPDKEVLQKVPSTFDFHEVFLSVLIDGKVHAQKTIHRLAVAPNVEKRAVHEQGLVGTFFYPKNMQHGPGVIVLGGSGGRIPEDVAQLLASHGYAAFALGFFGVPGLPERLKNIPLEYFQTAMQWFKSQSEVDKNHIAILGRSRGGELVLLLGATFPQEMQAIVAYVPGAFLASESWTYKNKPLPGVPYPSDVQEAEATQKGLIAQHTGSFDDPEESTSKYKWVFGSASQDVLGEAAIQVEKIQCPILLLSAEDDKMWQSTDFSNIIMQRLDEKKSTITKKHLHFPNAGHGVQNPYGPSIAGYPYFHPKIKKWHTIGGTREGNAHANEQAWKAVLEFLKETLNK